MKSKDHHAIRFGLLVALTRYMVPLLIVVLVVVVSLIVWNANDYHNLQSNLDVEYIKLMPAHDGSEFNVVHGEIILTVDNRAYITIGGDVVEKNLRYNSMFTEAGLTRTQSGQGFIIHYSGLLQLVDSKTVGDEVSILIRHGGSQTEIVAVVEGI